MTHTVLRAGGVALLVGLMGMGALSRVDRPKIPIDFGGTIERYGDDSIFISTSTAGLCEIRLTPQTVIRDGDTVAQIAALRPGRLVAVQGAHDDGGRLTAGQLLVWGAPK